MLVSLQRCLMKHVIKVCRQINNKLNLLFLVCLLLLYNLIINASIALVLFLYAYVVSFWFMLGSVHFLIVHCCCWMQGKILGNWWRMVSSSGSQQRFTLVLVLAEWKRPRGKDVTLDMVYIDDYPSNHQAFLDWIVSFLLYASALFSTLNAFR